MNEEDNTYVGLCATDERPPLIPSSKMKCTNPSCGHDIWIDNQKLWLAKQCRARICLCCYKRIGGTIPKEIPSGQGISFSGN